MHLHRKCPPKIAMLLPGPMRAITIARLSFEEMVTFPGLEPLFLRMPRGAMSRVRLSLYRFFGMHMGKRNRMEGGGRVRRCSQISIGDYNTFTQGCALWPADADFDGIRI